MANWCEGTIKITGIKNDIKKLLEENLVDSENKKSLRFTGTRRAFILHNTIPNFENELTLNYAQAWGVDMLFFQTMANTYNVKFHILCDEIIEKSLERYLYLKREKNVNLKSKNFVKNQVYLMKFLCKRRRDYLALFFL